MDKLNPKFPYRIEKAHWYLLFLWRVGILTTDEFDIAVERLNKITGEHWGVENDETSIQERTVLGM